MRVPAGACVAVSDRPLTQLVSRNPRNELRLWATVPLIAWCGWRGPQRPGRANERRWAAHQIKALHADNRSHWCAQTRACPAPFAVGVTSTLSFTSMLAVCGGVGTAWHADCNGLAEASRHARSNAAQVLAYKTR